MSKPDDDLFSVKDLEEEEEEDEEEEDEDTNSDIDLEDDKMAEKVFQRKGDENGDEDDDELPADEEDEDGEETDYGDEEYFQKIDKEMRQDFVASFHPQLKMPSNEEIRHLVQLRRNDKGIIDDPLHRTEPFVRKYERTHVIGVRASQLEHGAEPWIPIDPNMNETAIATEEFQQKVLPFIIWRPFPDGSGEFWKLSDLEIID